MTPNMDKTARAYAARNALKDETLMDALNDVQATINKELLSASTPEEREAKWHEFHSIERVKRRLSSWASDAPKQLE